MIHILTSYVIPTIVGMAFVCVPFYWCRAHGVDAEEFGLSWRTSKVNLMECLLITGAFLAPLTLISLSWPTESLPRVSPFGRTINLLIAGCSAAVIEEVFYRGWLQPLIRKHLGALLSIIITSAIFAASHVFVAQTAFLFAVFVPGCVMGFLRERHGNIATSTLFHAAGNVWAVWFVPLDWPAKEWVIRRLLQLLSDML
jgi:membrane protease YdiL (CAAX protease family)